MQNKQPLFSLGLLLAAALTACPSPASPPVTGTDSFTLKPAETTLEVGVGGEVSSFVDLERKAGFTDTVQMAFTDLPAGFDQEWTRDSADGDCSLVLKVAESVKPGTYALTLAGQVGAGVQSAGLKAQATTVQTRSINVLVRPGAITGFSLTTNPSIIEVAQGNSATFRVNTQKGTFTQGNVNLSVEGLPNGASITFAKNPVTLESNTGTDAQVIVSNAVAAQEYLLKVKGTADGLTRTANLKLTVRPAAAAGFNLTANPSSKTLVRGAGAQGIAPSVSVERLLGFAPGVIFSVQNVPANVTAELLPGGSPDRQTLKLTAGANAALGNASLTVKAVGGNVVKTVPIALEIVSNEAQPLATNQGGVALDGAFKTVGGFTTVSGSVPLAGGKALVLGNKSFQGQGLLAVLNADGSPDAGFGAGGFVNIAATLNHASQQADGKILVAGTVPLCDGQGECNGSNALLTRLNANGSPDTGFDGDGTLVIPNSSGVAAFQANGKVHLFTGTEWIRLNANGSFDTGFDGDGRKAIPNLGVNGIVSVALDAQGRVVVYGKASASGINAAFARMSLDGVLDVGFGQGGKASVQNFGPAVNAGLNSLTVDANGRIVVAGVFLNESIPGNGRVSFAVARLTANGTLDTGFDNDGVGVSGVGSAPDDDTFGADALAVAVAPNGKITAFGKVGSQAQVTDYAAARWNENGSVDASFGQGGKFRFGLQLPGVIGGNRVERFVAAQPLADGRILALGVSGTSANGSGDLTAVRFKP